MNKVNMINFYIAFLLSTVALSLMSRLPRATGPAWALRMLLALAIIALGGVVTVHRSPWWRVGAGALIVAICAYSWGAR